jgi:hypothetical protein
MTHLRQFYSLSLTILVRPTTILQQVSERATRLGFERIIGITLSFPQTIRTRDASQSLSANVPVSNVVESVLEAIRDSSSIALVSFNLSDQGPWLALLPRWDQVAGNEPFKRLFCDAHGSPGFNKIEISPLQEPITKRCWFYA